MQTYHQAGSELSQGQVLKGWQHWTNISFNNCSQTQSKVNRLGLFLLGLYIHLFILHYLMGKVFGIIAVTSKKKKKKLHET